MSIRHAPPKWKHIASAAKACGAKEWAMRKWIERGTIPAVWKLKVFRYTHGAISFDDMVFQNIEDAA